MYLDENYRIKMVVADETENGYGDIFHDMADLLRVHPDCQPVFGFCLTGPDGVTPPDCRDWHDDPAGAYAEYLEIKAKTPAKLDTQTLLRTIRVKADCRIETMPGDAFSVTLIGKTAGKTLHNFQGASLEAVLAHALLWLDENISQYI